MQPISAAQSQQKNDRLGPARRALAPGRHEGRSEAREARAAKKTV